MKYTVDNFSLSNEDLMFYETIFHNANGYLGVRSNFEEGYKEGYDSIRGMYINGFYDFVPMKQAEKLCGLIEEKQTMLNVADTQTIICNIGNQSFDMFQGTIVNSNRILDMEEGCSIRNVEWISSNNKKFKISSKRMASLEYKNLFVIEYSITSDNYDGEIELESWHEGKVENYCNPNDPRVAGERFQHLDIDEIEYKDGTSRIIASTVRSKLQVCSIVKNRLSKECEKTQHIGDSCIKEKIKFSISKGEKVTLLKYTILNDSLREKELLQNSLNLMNQIVELPIQNIYDKQKTQLDQYWEDSVIDIQGDDSLNMALQFNLYQLYQSAGRDEYCSIAAKGLSGEGYEGHYFWDTEMYILPFFTVTNPKISKQLLLHRYLTLPEAKENAKNMGHEVGALYPWRTIMGKECSGYFPSGSAAYHINGDISYALVQYYFVTEDMDFLEKYGVEMLIETARLWLDVGNYVNGKFNINEVTGPDEYTCMVDNNYFTNAVAKYNLHYAKALYELLEQKGKNNLVKEKTGITKEELDAFSQASDNMYLPYDETLKINPQDDSFLKKKKLDLQVTDNDKFPLLLNYHPLYLYRLQVCKQADTVLSHFILEDYQSLDTIANSFEYYEKITTHDSSLSTSIFSIIASKLGDVKKAYKYFGDSAKVDLYNLHKNTKDGIHTANMAGNYLAVVYGFGGLRIKKEGIYLNPLIPEEWDEYQFIFSYKGRKIKVFVTQEEKKITLLRGDELQISIDGEKRILSKEITIHE